jgi:hypothetical protein
MRDLDKDGGSHRVQSSLDKLTLHEECYGPTNGTLCLGPGTTEDIVKIPDKKSNEEQEESSPQSLYNNSLLLVGNSSGRVRPCKKVNFAQKRCKHE